MGILDLREPVSAWSHCAGLMLAFPGTLLLWRRSAGDRGKQLALLVYGLSLAFCYSASTLYHGVRLPAARIAAFARLDGVGIFALIAAGRHFSPLLSTCVYLGMGWGVVVCYSQIAQVVTHRALVPIVVGGLSYSVGAVLNLLHWPALWPGVFGAHELFHLFVLAGSLAHYLFILKVVVPFVWGS